MQRLCLTLRGTTHSGYRFGLQTTQDMGYSCHPGVAACVRLIDIKHLDPRQRSYTPALVGGDFPRSKLRSSRMLLIRSTRHVKYRPAIASVVTVFDAHATVTLYTTGVKLENSELCT